MRLIAFDDDFLSYHDLGAPISIRAKWYYNDIGVVTIIATTERYNLDLLQVGRILYDLDTGQGWILQNITVSDKDCRITADGYTLNWLLNTRCVAKRARIRTIEPDVKQLILDNLRGLPRITVAADSGLPAKTRARIEGGQVLDQVMPLLKIGGYGHRMVFDETRLTWAFEVYQGADRRTGDKAVIFSDLRGTAEQLQIGDDASALKNTFYVKVTWIFEDPDEEGGIGEETELMCIGYEGEDGVRRELWIDEEYKETDEEDDDEFMARVNDEIAVKAEQMLRRLNFTVTVPAEDLGSYYSLGDMCTCISTKYGLTMDARISGAEYAYDSTGETCTLILGEPKIKLLEALKNGY